jgi:hypothetical protein
MLVVAIIMWRHTHVWYNVYVSNLNGNWGSVKDYEFIKMKMITEFVL